MRATQSYPAAFLFTHRFRVIARRREGGGPYFTPKSFTSPANLISKMVICYGVYTIYIILDFFFIFKSKFSNLSLSKESFNYSRNHDLKNAPFRLILSVNDYYDTIKNIEDQDKRSSHSLSLDSLRMERLICVRFH